MSVRYLLHLLGMTLVGLLLMACGASPAVDPTATPDLVATEVAVKKSAAATLTAEAELAQPPVTEAVPVAVVPSPTPLPSGDQTDNDTIELLPATDTPTSIPPTDTPVPILSTDTPTPVPPTDTPLPPALPPLVDVPVDGGRSNLQGNIRIPGFTKDELQLQDNNVTFRDRLAFQVIVYDPNKGNHDGDGIKEVNIKIFGPSGKVHERTERNAGYCVFGGGEPDCNVFNLKDNYRWPEEDEPIENGFHNVEIRITTDNNETEDWVWSFQIDKKN